MRNGMRYIFILCLFLGFASCQEDVLQPSYKGKGRLVLKDVDISAEASAETVTRATSTFTAPTASELTYKVTDTQTGEVVYNQTGEFTHLMERNTWEPSLICMPQQKSSGLQQPRKQQRAFP